MLQPSTLSLVANRMMSTSGLPLSAWPYLILRSLLTPYRKFLDGLPVTGRFLDLACGYGILSGLLASSGTRTVVGSDQDAGRICLAKRLWGDLCNLEFQEGSLTSALGHTTFDGILLIDSMHYLMPEVQKQVLDNIYASLRPGGLLVLRDIDWKGWAKSPWPEKFTYFFETLSVRIRYGKTALHFRSLTQWNELLRSSGFEPRSSWSTRFPFADTVFIFEKSPVL